MILFVAENENQHVYDRCKSCSLREQYLSFVQKFDGDSDCAGHLGRGHCNREYQARLEQEPNARISCEVSACSANAEI